jgi:hypothetical protein
MGDKGEYRDREDGEISERRADESECEWKAIEVDIGNHAKGSRINASAVTPSCGLF